MKNILSLLALTLLMAAQPALAQEYRAKPVTIDGVITHLSSTTAPSLYNVKVPIYTVYTVPVLEPRTCTKVVCRDIPGNGTQGDWKGYFTSPHHERAQRLADAIKGIGLKTAEKILETGLYFNSKPRTWDAFSREISSAESTLLARGYKGHFADLVINVYGVENSKNLGYYEGSSCQQVQYACNVWTEKEVEEFAYHLDRQVRVAVNNTSLQDFETESYKITVGMLPQAIQIEKPSAYNTYDASVAIISSAQSLVTFNAIGRNRITLPSEAGTATLFKSEHGFNIALSVNPNYLPKDNDAGSELQLVYRVCQTDWFGGCHKAMIPWTTETIRKVSADIHVSENLLKKGSKYKVWYKLIRTGSRFYNNEGVSNTTDSVKAD